MPKHYDLSEESYDLETLAREVQGLAVTEKEKRVAAKEVVRRQQRFTNPLTRGIIVGALTSLLVVGGLTFAIHLCNQAFAAKIEMPDVLGLDYGRAKIVLDKLGLKVKIDRVQSASKPQGTVVAMKPLAHTRLNPAAEVTISVIMRDEKPGKQSGASETRLVQDIQPQPQSAAAQQVVVPDIVNVIDTKAQKQLEELHLGLTITEIPKQDASQPEHVVLSCEPPPGSPLQQGDAVHLVVNSLSAKSEQAPSSSTASSSVLPDYAGHNGQDVVNDLIRQGFSASYSLEKSHLQSPGNVIKTDPPAGSQPRPGNAINVVIAAP